MNNSTAYILPGLALTPELIIDTVCRYYNTTFEQLKSRCRKRDTHCEPRQIIMALLYSACGKTMEVSAWYFNRDHATLLSGLHVIKNQYQYNKDFREKIACILRNLGLPDDHIDNIKIRKFATKKAPT